MRNLTKLLVLSVALVAVSGVALARGVKPGEYTMTSPSSPGNSTSVCINADTTFQTDTGFAGHWLNRVVGSVTTAHLAGDASVTGFTIHLAITVHGSNNSQFTEW